MIKEGDWTLLRRDPPCFLGIVNGIGEIEKLVRNQLAAMSGMKVEFEPSVLMPV